MLFAPRAKFCCLLTMAEESKSTDETMEGGTDDIVTVTSAATTVRADNRTGQVGEILSLNSF